MAARRTGFSARARRGLIGAIAVFMVLATMPPALAETVTPERLGLPSDGAVVRSECAGAAMTGVRGDIIYPSWSTNGALGRLLARCGNAEGAWIGSASDGEFLDEYSLCPEGQVVTGIGGREGSVIDAIEALCQAVNSDNVPVGDVTRGASVGGTGGGLSPDIMCPTGTTAVGLEGVHGGFDIGTYAGLVCENLSTDTTGPVTVMTKPAKRFPTAARFGVAWGSSDPLAVYDVRRRSASTASGFGAYQAFRSRTAAKAGSFTGGRGTTHCFSARARDLSQNVSGWTRESCTAVPLDDRDLSKGRGWDAAEDTGFFRGTYRTTTNKFAVMWVRDVAAKRVAVRALTCPKCGVIRLQYNGDPIARFDLQRSTRAVRYFSAPAFSKVRKGTFEIVVLSSDKRVTVDALGLSRK